MALSSDDININTLIGPGSAVAGNLRVAGFVRIDGDIAGDLETTGRVIIGEHARIRGNILASAVIVGGIVIGNVVAQDSITLFSTAAVVGDVVSRKVKIEEGVVLHGMCVSISDEKEFEEAKNGWLTMTSIQKRVFSSSSGQ